MSYRKVSFNIRLEEDPAKLEEAAVVEKISAGFAGSNTYLGMMFTRRWADWVIEQIRWDFNPNLFEMFDDGKIVIEEQGKELVVLRAQVGILNDFIEGLEEDKDELKGVISDNVHKAAEKNRGIAMLRIEKQEAIDNSDDALRISAQVINRKDREIESLKARLWDQHEIAPDAQDFMTEEEYKDAMREWETLKWRQERVAA